MRAFIALSAISGAAALDKTLGTVHVLNDDVVDDFMSAEKDNGVFVKFYAPWCGHCKELAPKFEACATILKDQYKSQAALAKIDCTDSAASKFCGKYGVSSYPTLKWFKDGEDIKYSGGRTAEAIARWINKQAGNVLTDGEPDNKTQAWTITYFGSRKSKVFKEFENAAKADTETIDWHFVEEKGKKKPGKLQIQHKLEEPIVIPVEDQENTDAKFDGINTEKVKELMKEHTLPRFYGEITGATYAHYDSFKGDGVMWVLMPMTDATMKEVAEKKRQLITDVIGELGHDKWRAAFTNTAFFGSAIADIFGEKANVNGIDADALKIGLWLNIEGAADKVKFVYDGEADKSAIVAWAKESLEKAKKGERDSSMPAAESETTTTTAKPTTAPVSGDVAALSDKVDAMQKTLSQLVAAVNEIAGKVGANKVDNGEHDEL